MAGLSQRKMWFAPKARGFGAGMPIAWEGWLAMLVYFAVVFAGIWGADRYLGLPPGSGLLLILKMTGLVIATIVFIIVARTRTQGGWRWRSGGE